VLVRRWAGRPLSGRSWAAAVTVVLGIITFLALAGPSGKRHHRANAAVTGQGVANDAWRQGRAVLAAVLLAAAALVLLAVGLGVPGTGASGRRRAVLLALAAGLADSSMAVVTAAFAHVAGHGLVALLTSWAVYALVIGGIGNVLLTQTAYQAGRPMITLPLISAVTPMASVAVGIGLLGETPRLGAAGLAAAAIVAVVTGLALASLARSASLPVTPAPAGSPGPDSPDGPEEGDGEGDNRLPAVTGTL